VIDPDLVAPRLKVALYPVGEHRVFVVAIAQEYSARNGHLLSPQASGVAAR
jgi:hypothetical protein